MSRRSRKRWIRAVIVIVVLILILVVGLCVYVRPSEPIGFAEPIQVPLHDRIEEIIERHAIEFTISEAEMNGYASEKVRSLLATNAKVSRWNITGMHIELEPNQVLTRLQVEPGWGISAEINVDASLTWDAAAQQIKVVPTAFRLKDIPLPVQWLPIPGGVLTIPLRPVLPDWVYVTDLQMQDEKWIVRLGLRVLQ
ncbi:hypothetical protein [Paenibacillus marinisediminis]